MSRCRLAGRFSGGGQGAKTRRLTTALAAVATVARADPAVAFRPAAAAPIRIANTVTIPPAAAAHNPQEVREEAKSSPLELPAVAAAIMVAAAARTAATAAARRVMRSHRRPTFPRKVA